MQSLAIARRCRADDPARDGGGRHVVGGGVKDQAKRVAGSGRERKPPRRHLIDAARAHFADHHAERAAAQRLLHRPQHVAPARGGNRDQLLGRNPDAVETGAIKRAIFSEREVLGDPKHG